MPTLALAHKAQSDAAAINEAILKANAITMSAVKSQIMCSSRCDEPVSASRATGRVVS